MNRISINPVKILSYSKTSGLRSMHHIKGLEREIIEAYKNELSHDIWGNANKLKEWAFEKVDFISFSDYPSKLLDPDMLYEGRINGINNWYNLIKTSKSTKNDPFMQLKVMRFVTDNLKSDNKALTPVINSKIFEDAVYMVKKYGVGFKKTYNNLLKTFNSGLDVKIEDVFENGVRGKWFNISVPNWAEAERNPSKFNKVKEFISVLSQGSNWCTKTPRTVGREFSGCTFDIFIDDKGIPQLCLTRIGNNNTDWFRFIRGNDQYKPIPDKYKCILKQFFIKRNMEDAVVGTQTNHKSVINLCV